MKWLLHVSKDNAPCCDPLEIEGAVDLGRQDSTLAKEQGMGTNGHLPSCYPMSEGVTRVVVASVNEHTMLRHIQIEPVNESGSFRVRNLSRHVAFHLTGGVTVPAASAVEGPSPLEFKIDRWTLRAEHEVEEEEEENSDIEMLEQAAPPPGSKNIPGAPLSSVMQSIAVGGMDSVNLIRWLRATLDVLQEAASSREFLPRAARAVVELIHLDGCRVLLHDGERWTTGAEHNKRGVDRVTWRPSMRLLEQMR
ncbi:MAG TPA: hypothetical protein VE988_02815, partial [Gemmataceae bacterium]|nr:hypothetical protein [Gemmataceae bacterium]